MSEKKSIMGIFWGHFTSMFIAAIIAVSIAGWLNSGNEAATSGLLQLGREGLAFSSIAQLLGWSLVLSILTTLLTSDVILKKVMLLWRAVALIILGIISTVIFAVIFQWIPNNEWMAWVAFLIFFTVPFGGGLLGMVAATKAADKHYNQRLNDYRSNQNKEEEDSE